MFNLTRRRRSRVGKLLFAPVLWAIAAVIGMIAAYVIGMAWWQSRGSRLEPLDLLVPRLSDAAIAVWLFWVGSSIGSFLNVVAWRMPRGKSLNGRSYCPRCDSRLRARDNFPVFGWVALRGRCRTCRLPISRRYPVVEFCVGAAIAVVGIGELYQLSLPGQQPRWQGGLFWAPVVTTPLLATLLFHTVALSLSWAVGLIRMDGHRLPPRLAIGGLTVLAVAMFCYPGLMVVGWQVEAETGHQLEWQWIDAIIRVVSALAAAVVYARYLARVLCPGADPKLDPLGEPSVRLLDLIVILSIPALVTGWQPLAAVVVMASLFSVAADRLILTGTDALGRLAIAMPIAMTTQLFFWRWLDSSGWWPPASGRPWVMLASIGLLLLAPLWLRDLSRACPKG